MPSGEHLQSAWELPSVALTDVLILEQQAQAQQFESIDCSTTTAALARQLHPGHRWDKQATTQARQLG